MKRTLSAITLLAVMILATTASAQFQDKGFLLTLNAGTIVATSERSDESINVNSAGFTLEKVLDGGRFSVGASFIWLWADEVTEVITGDPQKVTYSAAPFVFTGRWNFLNSRFAANIGLGIGVHTSTQKLDEGTTDEISSSVTGMAMSVPVTAAYFLAPDFYLQVVFTPSWMNTTPMRDDLAYSINAGLGFQW